MNERHRHASQKGLVYRLKSYVVTYIVVGWVTQASCFALVEAGDLEKVRLLMTQSEQAESRFRSMTYSADARGFEANMEIGLLKFQRRFSVSQRGLWRASSSENKLNLSRDATEQTYTAKAVLNDDYFAFNAADRPLQQFDHHSIKNASRDEESESFDYGGPNPIRHAFGDGRHFLHEYAIEQMPAFKWKVDEVPDGPTPLLRLSAYATENGELGSEWLIDPSRGFMVVRLRRFDKGFLQIERLVVPTEVDGAWLPKTVTERKYLNNLSKTDQQALGIDNPKSPVFDSTITFSDYTLDVSLPDDQFRFPVLRATPGSALQITSPDGATKVVVVGLDGTPPSPIARPPSSALQGHSQDIGLPTDIQAATAPASSGSTTSAEDQAYSLSRPGEEEPETSRLWKVAILVVGLMCVAISFLAYHFTKGRRNPRQ